MKSKRTKQKLRAAEKRYTALLEKLENYLLTSDSVPEELAVMIEEELSLNKHN